MANIRQTMEVVSLTGNIAIDEQDRIIFHLRGVFADDEHQTIGGHVKDSVAGAPVELFVHRAYRPMQRVHDNETGLQILDV